MKTEFTDTQLKQALAKMLPLNLCHWESKGDTVFLAWSNTFTPNTNNHTVRDTELLHLCWLVEETLNKNSYNEYEIDLDELITIQTGQFIGRLTSATWQQRTIALAKVKGVEIV